MSVYVWLGGRGKSIGTHVRQDEPDPRVKIAADFFPPVTRKGLDAVSAALDRVGVRLGHGVEELAQFGERGRGAGGAEGVLLTVLLAVHGRALGHGRRDAADGGFGI